LNQSTAIPEGLEALAPVRRETSQDRVYKQLRTALIRGAFDAGALFIVSDVAQRMSVSSMPVREALARLVSERALEAMENRRVRVPLLSRDNARGINNARTLIEGALAGQALPQLTAGDLARLDETIEEYETAQDAGAVARANQAFHFCIYQRAADSVLLPFVESLWMQAGPYIRAAARLHKPLMLSSGAEHHRGILQAIRAGDAATLKAELTADISRVFAILENAGNAFWDDTEEGADG
jgi:DNA-binding GntR family transcriptional regulator